MAAVTIRRAALPHRIRACRHAPHLRDSADAPSLRRTSATPSGSLSGASLHPRRNACRRASAATTPAAAASPHPRSPLSTRAVSTPTHLPGPPGGDPQISRMESFPASSPSLLPRAAGQPCASGAVRTAVARAAGRPCAGGADAAACDGASSRAARSATLRGIEAAAQLDGLCPPARLRRSLCRTLSPPVICYRP